MRIADWVGTNGTAYYGQGDYPQAAAVIMQYTALSEVTGNEPASITVLVQGTVSHPTRVCRRELTTSAPMAQIQRSRYLKDCRMVSVLEQELLLKAGLTMP